MARRTGWRRWGIGIAAGLLSIYACVVVLRVLYPCERLDLVRAHAEAAALDPALVCSLVRAESRFHADAVSPRGAVGLMQLMPETAAWIADRIGLVAPGLTDRETNLRLGVAYLRYLIDRFGDVNLALAAYNAGPSRVDQWVKTGEAPYPETAAFVRRVTRGVPVYRILLAAPILVRITPSLPL